MEHSRTLWNTRKKIIGIIKRMYKESGCTVRVEGRIGEWFQIVTKVYPITNVVSADDRLGNETKHGERNMGLGMERK